VVDEEDNIHSREDIQVDKRLERGDNRKGAGLREAGNYRAAAALAGTPAGEADIREIAAQESWAVKADSKRMEAHSDHSKALLEDWNYCNAGKA
jgi:hypothetical protein